MGSEPPHADPAPGRRRFVWAPAVVLPALGLALFSSTGRDDSHITYWAAHAVSTYGEIVNYNGDRLEQSSSLLHTVVLAGLHLVTRLPVAQLGFLLGIVMGAATVVLAGLTAERIRPGSGWIAALLAATNPFLVYWSFGGLETSLAAAATAAFVCACAVFAVQGSRRALGVATAAIVGLVAVRPETGIIATLALPALALWTLLRSDLRRYLRRVAALVAISAAAFGALVAWRLAYFGVTFPQPVLAKIGGTRPHEGLTYLQSTLGQPHGVILMILASAGAVVAMRRNNVASALAAATAGAYLSFVLLSGGDWMEGGRLIAPAVPLLAALAAAVPVRRWTLAVPTLLAVAQVAGLVALADSASTGKPLWAEIVPAPPASGAAEFHWFERNNRVHARHALFYDDLKAIVIQVSEQVDSPVVASGQAGLLMYRLSVDPDVPPFRFVDLFNLATRDLQECAPTARITALGRFTPYSEWLGDSDCAAVKPDIVFDRKVFAEWGGLHDDYVVVHEQTGLMSVAGSTLEGADISAEMFIAVRRDLAVGSPN